MRRLIVELVLLALVFNPRADAQHEDPAAQYGFRHFVINYQGIPVDILVKSKKDEELKKKPLFLFCQGSLPVPLIIKYETAEKSGIVRVFVFDPDSLSNEYHLAIIGKPDVPLVAEEKKLMPGGEYADSAGNFSKRYVEHNLLSWYVARNIAAIKFLQRQSWVSKAGLVVAGHSEGAIVAARTAFEFPGVTRLIFSGGSPLGRVMAVIERERAKETDSSDIVGPSFDFWKSAIADPDNLNSTGDTKKGYYQFSAPPPIEYLMKLKIPVLVTYGTKDLGAVAANDYLRVTAIRLKKTNFTFRDYPRLEHNFFPLKANGEANFDIFNWDRVAGDWRHWLKTGIKGN